MTSMTLNVPKNVLRKTARQHKVIELKAQGKTIQQIAEQLKVSEKTIDRDLKSQTVQTFVDELIRQQVLDINQADELPLRLQFRSDLLDKMLPKKQEIKQDVTSNTNADAELLRLIAEIERNMGHTKNSKRTEPETSAN